MMPPLTTDLEAQSKAAAATMSAMAQIRARLAGAAPATPVAAMGGFPGAGVGGLPGAGVGPTPLINLPATQTIVIDCPKTYVGLVIGRGGETIKLMQDQSSAKIQIDQNVPAGHPCKITVSGMPYAVEAAQRLIQEKMDSGKQEYIDIVPSDAPSSGANMIAIAKPNERREIMDVPQQLVGKVIGRGGETIRSLQQRSGANITIDQVNHSFPNFMLKSEK
jgi:far upstream element-binding protein